MRKVDQLLRATVAFIHFKSSLVVRHTYGPCNPADPVSRGKLKEVAQLASSLQFTMTRTMLLPLSRQFLEDVLQAQEVQTRLGSWTLEFHEP